MGSNARAVHSSGGAAGGVVSESQGILVQAIDASIMIYIYIHIIYLQCGHDLCFDRKLDDMLGSWWSKRRWLDSGSRYIYIYYRMFHGVVCRTNHLVVGTHSVGIVGIYIYISLYTTVYIRIGIGRPSQPMCLRWS